MLAHGSVLVSNIVVVVVVVVVVVAVVADGGGCHSWEDSLKWPLPVG